jgi:hypothetical protein
VTTFSLIPKGASRTNLKQEATAPVSSNVMVGGMASKSGTSAYVSFFFTNTHLVLRSEFRQNVRM